MIAGEKAEGTLRGEYMFLTYIYFKLTTENPKTNQEKKIICGIRNKNILVLSIREMKGNNVFPARK